MSLPTKKQRQLPSYSEVMQPTTALPSYSEVMSGEKKNPADNGSPLSGAGSGIQSSTPSSSEDNNANGIDMLKDIWSNIKGGVNKFAEFNFDNKLTAGNLTKSDIGALKTINPDRYAKLAKETFPNNDDQFVNSEAGQAAFAQQLNEKTKMANLVASKNYDAAYHNNLDEVITKTAEPVNQFLSKSGIDFQIKPTKDIDEAKNQLQFLTDAAKKNNEEFNRNRLVTFNIPTKVKKVDDYFPQNTKEVIEGVPQTFDVTQMSDAEIESKRAVPGELYKQLIEAKQRVARNAEIDSVLHTAINPIETQLGNNLYTAAKNTNVKDLNKDYVRSIGEQIYKIKNPETYALYQTAGGYDHTKAESDQNYDSDLDRVNKDIMATGLNAIKNDVAAGGTIGDYDNVYANLKYLNYKFASPLEEETRHRIAAALKAKGITPSSASEEQKDDVAATLPVENQEVWFNKTKKTNRTELPDTGFWYSAGNSFVHTGTNILKSGSVLSPMSWATLFMGVPTEQENAKEVLRNQMSSDVLGENPETRQVFEELKAKQKNGTITPAELNTLNDYAGFNDLRSSWDKFKDGSANMVGMIGAVTMDAIPTMGGSAMSSNALKLRDVSIAENATQAGASAIPVVNDAATQTIIQKLTNTQNIINFAKNKNEMFVLMHHDNALKATELFPDNDSKKAWYTAMTDVISVALPNLLPTHKISALLDGEAKSAVADIVDKLAVDKLDKAVIANTMKETAAKIIGKVGTLVVGTEKTAAEAALTMSLMTLGNNITQAILKPGSITGNDISNNFRQTFSSVFMDSQLIGLVGGYGDVQKRYGRVGTDAIYDATEDINNVNSVKYTILQQQAKGELSQTQVNEKLSILQAAAELRPAVNDLQKEENLSTNQSKRIFINLLNERILKNQVRKLQEAGSPEALITPKENRIKEINAITTKIIGKELPVDENYSTVEAKPAEEIKPELSNAIDLLNKAREGGQLGVFKNIEDNAAIKMIAQQAQGLDESGKPYEGADAAEHNKIALEGTQNQFGKDLVDAAIKLHPAEPVVETGKDFKGLRDDDFATKYFDKAEYKKWSDAEIENPTLAKQMIQDKKDELLKVAGSNNDAPAEAVDENTDFYKIGKLYDANGIEYLIRNPKDTNGDYVMQKMDASKEHKNVPQQEIIDRINNGELFTQKPIKVESKQNTAPAGNDASLADVTYIQDYAGDGVKELAHKVKEGNPEAIDQMATEMASKVPENAVLIPMPSRNGKATNMKLLAEAISKISGAPVADVLTGKERQSLYEAKKKGETVSADDLKMQLNGELPEGKVPVIVDNVLATGATFKAAKEAIPEAKILVHSVDNAKEKVIPASAKSKIEAFKNKKAQNEAIQSTEAIAATPAAVKAIEDEGAAAEHSGDPQAVDAAIEKIDQLLKTTPEQQARDAGEKTVDGEVIKRPDPVQAVVGKDVDILFSKTEKQPAKYAVIERQDMQPSHKNGIKNEEHFIPEAQPRDRGALAVLRNEAKKKADSLDPNQLSEGNIAYFGSPIINNRGEVIQGNGRAEAIDYYYRNNKEDSKGYKAMIESKAKDLGLDAEAVSKMKEPVLVRLADVDDERAIILGNFTSSDLEDVKQKSADSKSAINKLKPADLKQLSETIGSKVGETETLKGTIRGNAKSILDLLMDLGVLRSDNKEQYIGENGVTPEGVEAAYNIVKQLLFEGGNSDLSGKFQNLPHLVREAIEKTIPAILTNREFKDHIQSVIEILHDKEESGTKSFDTWAKQFDIFKDNKSPIDIYSKSDLALARNFDLAPKQKDVAAAIKEIAVAMNGKPGDMFEPAKEPVSFEDALNERGITYAVKENTDSDVSDMTEIVKDLVDNGTHSLSDIQEIVAKELGDDSAEMKNLVEEAFNEYGKAAAQTQKEINVVKAVNKKISKWLTKLFGGEAKDKVSILSNEEELLKKAKDLDNPQFMNDPDGKILGFSHEGKIYLNGEHLNPNTSIHEAGHIWTEWAKLNDKAIYNRGVELTENSQYLKKAKESTFYQSEVAKLPEADRELYFKHEALAMAIGDKGAQFVSESRRTSFKDWLGNLWTTIKNMAGLKNISGRELQNLTFTEFAKRAARDILHEDIATENRKRAADGELYTHINKAQISLAEDLAKEFPLRGESVTWDESVASGIAKLAADAKEGESLADVANRKIAQWGKDIDNEIFERGKSTFNPSDEDLAIMSFYRTHLNETLAGLSDAFNSGSFKERQDAINQAKDIQAKLFGVDHVLSETAAVAGRSFYIRQMIAKMDAPNNLMVRRMDIMERQDGEPLSPEQEEAVTKIVAEEKKLQKEGEENLKKYSQEDFDAKVKAEVDRQLKEKGKSTAGKKETGVSDEKRKAAADGLRKAADRFERAWKAGGDNIHKKGISIDVQKMIADAMRYIADKIEDGKLKIPEIISEALSKYAKGNEQEVRSGIRETLINAGLEPSDINDRRENALDKIKELATDEESNNLTKSAVGQGLINELANHYIETGLRGKEVFNAMNRDLKELFPSITEQQVRDAYTKSGEYKLDKSDDIKKEIRQAQDELKNIATLETKIENARKNSAGAKNTAEKRKATETEDKLRKDLQKELDKHKIRLDRSPKEEIALKKSIAEAHNARMDKLAASIDERLKDDTLSGEEKTALQNLRNVVDLSKIDTETAQRIDDLLNRAVAELRNAGVDVVEHEDIFNELSKAVLWLKKDLRDMQQDISLLRYKKSKQNSIADAERKIENKEFDDQPRVVRTKTDAEAIRLTIEERKIEGKYHRLQELADQKSKKWWEKALSLGQSFLVNELIGGIGTAAVVASSAVTKQPLNTLTNLTFGSIAHFFNPSLSKAAGAEAPITLRQEANRYMAHYAAIGERGMMKIFDKSQSKLDEANKKYADVKEQFDKATPGTGEHDKLQKQLAKAEDDQLQALITHQSNFLLKWIGGSAWKDSADVFLKGASQLDELIGMAQKIGWKDMTNFEKTEFVMGMMGALHGTFKNFSARGEFAAAFTARLENKARRGIDISQTDEILRTATESYVNYLMGKYQEDNWVTLKMRQIGKLLEQADVPDYAVDQTPKNVTLGKAAAALYKGKYPIVRTGVNIGREAIVEYLLGTPIGLALHGKEIAAAAIKAAKSGQPLKEAIREHISQLSPDRVDLIFRCYRKGGVGLVGVALAAMGLIRFGGFPGDPDWKRKKGQLKPGELELFGVKLDHNNILAKMFLHSGATMGALMMGNTMQVMERRAGEGKSEGAIQEALLSDVKRAMGIIPIFADYQNPLTNFSVPYGRAAAALSEQFDKDENGHLIERDNSTWWNRFKNNSGFRKFSPVKGESTGYTNEGLSQLRNYGVLPPKVGAITQYTIPVDEAHPTGVMKPDEYKSFVTERQTLVNDGLQKLFSGSIVLERSDFGSLQLDLSNKEELKKQLEVNNISEDEFKGQLENRIKSVISDADKKAKKAAVESSPSNSKLKSFSILNQ